MKQNNTRSGNKADNVLKNVFSFLLKTIEGIGIIVIFGLALFDNLSGRNIIFGGEYSVPILSALLCIGIRFVRQDINEAIQTPNDLLIETKISNHLDFINTEVKKIVTNSMTIYHTPTGEKNYSAAIEKLLTVKKVQATYFFKNSWESKPFLSDVKEKYDFYYKQLDERVSKGLLHYEWITLVDTPGKDRSLIK